MHIFLKNSHKVKVTQSRDKHGGVKFGDVLFSGEHVVDFIFLKLLGVNFEVVIIFDIALFAFHDLVANNFYAFEFREGFWVFLHHFCQDLLDLHEWFAHFALVVGEGLIFLWDLIHQADFILLNGFFRGWHSRVREIVGGAAVLFIVALDFGELFSA